MADVEWNDAEWLRMLHDEHGPIGAIINRGAAIVTLDAKRRALKRTGAMAALIEYRVTSDERGVYADISSPVRSRARGFPYATVHEGKKVRDRRAHRSLKPALDALSRRGTIT